MTAGETSKDKSGEEILEKTDLRTLWSDTLLEMLRDAIENQWSSHAVREIVRELLRKGYSPNQLVKMVRKKYGPETAGQFRAKIRSTAVAGQEKPAADEKGG